MEVSIREMRSYFHNRLEQHITDVIIGWNKYWDEIGCEYDELEGHDFSKLQEPETLPYLYISWKYKCKMEGIDYDIPLDMVDRCNEATWHHVKHNKHHPEYWDTNLIDNSINEKDRDKPSGTLVDATRMDEFAIVEMCCDWCAVSKEHGSSPYNWAKANIGYRWEFTEEQERFIYFVLDIVWEVN